MLMVTDSQNRKKREKKLTYMDEIQDDVFLYSKKCYSKQSQNHQLDRADLSQQSSIGDQAASYTEICIDKAEERK